MRKRVGSLAAFALLARACHGPTDLEEGGGLPLALQNSPGAAQVELFPLTAFGH
jgi:hypothetical protein